MIAIMDSGNHSDEYKMPNEANREEWLITVCEHMKSWFVDLGFPIPPVKVKSGFHSAGKRSTSIAESWLESAEGENAYVIFVRPDHKDQIEVAAALAHQLCRVAVGNKDNYGHLFKHLAISVGLKGSQVESPPGAIFKELMKPVLKAVGKMPKLEITPATNDGKTRQTTRMLKVECEQCGYVARVSRKWIDKSGPPLCPQHGAMTPQQ